MLRCQDATIKEFNHSPKIASVREIKLVNGKEAEPFETWKVLAPSLMFVRGRKRAANLQQIAVKTSPDDLSAVNPKVPFWFEGTFQRKCCSFACDCASTESFESCIILRDVVLRADHRGLLCFYRYMPRQCN